jgi:hypothetical protein
MDALGLLAFGRLASFAFVRTYSSALVAALAAVAACSSGPQTNAPPANPPGPITGAPPVGGAILLSEVVAGGATGAADPRAAVQAFLDAAKAQDLQALSAVWGSVNGPARNTIPRADLEKRELVMMCFLHHETDSIGPQSAVAGNKLLFPVVLRRQSPPLVRATTATVVLGPSSRWYVETIELKAVEAFCQRRPDEAGPTPH